MARKMKDSGIEWIGEIPEGWEIKYFVQLFSQVKNKNIGLREKNLLSLSYGKIKQKSIETVGGLLPDNFEGYNIIDRNDIVLRLTDLQNDQHSLRVGLSPERGIITSAYCSIRVRGAESPNYLYYYLHTFDIAKGFYGMGSGVRQGLNWDGLKYIKILLPPQHEQDRISVFLNQKTLEIDSMLSKTISSIEEYKKLKQAVITQAVTKGVRGEREMKDSGVEWIGEIPKEWAVSPMKHFIDILPGYAFSSDDFCIEEGIPLLRGINVGVNEIRWDETVRWNHSISKQLESFFLKENDLVVGLDRPWISDGTRVAFIAKKDLPCLLLQRVCRIRTRCNFDMRWIYYWLSGSSFKDSLSTETTGISVPHISTKQIEQFIVAFPNQLEQTQICNYLDAKCAEIDKLIAKKEQLVKELESYKKSLIYEVVTGKREV